MDRAKHAYNVATGGISGDWTLSNNRKVRHGACGPVSLRHYRYCTCLQLMGKIDGYIARRYNMCSVVGSVLDPAADKVLITILTVALAKNGLIPRSFLC